MIAMPRSASMSRDLRASAVGQAERRLNLVRASEYNGPSFGFGCPGPLIWINVAPVVRLSICAIAIRQSVP
jgi:hypothetical protein